MRTIKNWNIARAKKYWLGRLLCRLAGDEKGAVMMEYVIVAVLIAAGCVVAVIMFGKTITGQFGVAAKAASGKADDAKAQSTAVQERQEKDAQAAADHHDALHGAKAAKGTNTGAGGGNASGASNGGGAGN